MKNILLSFFLFGLSACTLHADFIPEKNKLNDGTIGKNYNEQVTVIGGRVLSYSMEGKKVFFADITPDNIGLEIKYCDEAVSNNCVQITGVPTKGGIVKIRVSGGLGGGMLSRTGEFDKTYTLLIKNPDGSF
ncbi:hypothetical protein BS639_06465 [Rouxiella silvae]|uniref:Lipoprotein n=1 Tax=Rouxiella silvae TaxID=1646373 RepID=A0AA41BX10_9GAMM|nr:hypothetical protein [Rouxiella silvae]MBF6637469.1 hypothetical protein [Rouxiella silvae]ORJ22100.1 hypothetical protein BS639_06465 [Rouxiella silvae]